jgi:cathepsin L
MARIMQVGGLETEWTYPYVSYFGEASQCRFNGSAAYPFATISNYVVLPSNKYTPVMYHLANQGPLVVNVDASAWSDYESGVFNGCNNTNPDIDHVVQLVGYGTDATGLGDYWLVRNSWNAKWGEEGYIRIKRVGESKFNWKF